MIFTASRKLALSSCLLTASLAHGQQPPDVVHSDDHFNTAMGTDALKHINASVAEGNTATGMLALGFNTTGGGNTAMGDEALLGNNTGNANAAFGAAALAGNNSGNQNVAVGNLALTTNSTGNSNTAVGYYAAVGADANQLVAIGYNSLEHSIGDYNVAVGAGALRDNLEGAENTALGTHAMQNSRSGVNNTAVGFEAMEHNTSGGLNTVSGHFAGRTNTSGSYNTASGFRALYSNTTGSNNTFVGMDAGYGNTQGGSNTALGEKALNSNSTGTANVAVGFMAGSAVTGSNNIDIGSSGLANESGVIRLGSSGTHSAFYAAGVSSTVITTGSPVYVDANGKLGVGGASSVRFKEDVQPMGEMTERMDSLRPVVFRYKGDTTSTVHYGLIAEEVAQVYPELIVRDAGGGIQGVHYEELAPMLLNELKVETLRRRELQEDVTTLRKELDSLRRRLDGDPAGRTDEAIR